MNADYKAGLSTQGPIVGNLLDWLYSNTWMRLYTSFLPRNFRGGVRVVHGPGLNHRFRRLGSEL
jgi:hypothetical protein